MTDDEQASWDDGYKRCLGLLVSILDHISDLPDAELRHAITRERDFQKERLNGVRENV